MDLELDVRQSRVAVRETRPDGGSSIYRMGVSRISMDSCGSILIHADQAQDSVIGLVINDNRALNGRCNFLVQPPATSVNIIRADRTSQEFLSNDRVITGGERSVIIGGSTIGR